MGTIKSRKTNTAKNRTTKAFTKNCFYQTLFENANDAICILRDDKFIECNRHLLSLLGYSKEEMAQSSFYKIFLPESEAELKIGETLKLVVKGEPQLFEWPILHKNKTHFYAEISLVKIDFNAESFIQATIRDITAKRQTDLELVRSEERFRVLFDRSPLPIVLLQDQKIVYVNNQFLSTFKVKHKDETVDESILRFIADHNQYDFKEMLSSHKKDLNIPAECDVMAVQSDKTEFFVNFTFASIIINDVTFTVCFIKDITEQKKAEFAIKNSEIRFKHLVDSVTDYIFIMLVDLNTCLINNTGHSPGCFSVTGYSDSEFEEDNFLWYNIIYQEDRTIISNQLNIMLCGGEPPAIEHRIIHKNGSMRWVRNTAVLRHTEGPSLVFYDILISDITEQRLAEEALRNSEHRMKMLAEATFEGVIFSENATIIDINQQMLDMIKATREEVIYKSLFEFIAPESREVARRRVSQNEIIPVELILVRSDGTTFPTEIRAQLLIIDGKKVRVSAVRDISEKKETERIILNAIIEAEERERNHFSRELHDGLGPTLSTVKLYFQWLADTADPEKRKNIIEKCNRNFDEAMATLKEISNKLSPRVLNSLGIVPALNNFIHKLNEAMQSPSIDFNYNCELRFDKNIEITIYRIASELINNSIKYAKASEINVTLQFDAEVNKLQLLYSDNGVGFDLNMVLNERKGFGLTNIIQRVNTLNGKINLNSNIGQGMSVKIELPLERALTL